MAREQAQMDAHTVQHAVPARNVDLAMQQSADLVFVLRDVLIVPAEDRESSEDRVAVVAAVVYRVLAVGEIGPDRVGKNLALGLHWPVFETARMALVTAQHLLQKYQIGVQRAQMISQLVYHH